MATKLCHNGHNVPCKVGILMDTDGCRIQSDVRFQDIAGCASLSSVQSDRPRSPAQSSRMHSMSHLYVYGCYTSFESEIVCFVPVPAGDKLTRNSLFNHLRPIVPGGRLASPWDLTIWTLAVITCKFVCFWCCKFWGWLSHVHLPSSMWWYDANLCIQDAIVLLCIVMCAIAYFSKPRSTLVENL